MPWYADISTGHLTALHPGFLMFWYPSVFRFTRYFLCVFDPKNEKPPSWFFFRTGAWIVTCPSLLGLLLVFFGLLDVACAVFLLEPFYSPGSIDVFLLARVERMAHWAYLCVDFFCCAVGLECIATAAVDHHFIVLWMYIFFHNYITPKYLKLRIITILVQTST